MNQWEGTRGDRPDAMAESRKRAHSRMAQRYQAVEAWQAPKEGQPIGG